MGSITLYFFPQEPRPAFVAHPPLSPQPQGRLKAAHLNIEHPPSNSSHGLLNPRALGLRPPCSHSCYAGRAGMAEQDTGTFHRRIQHYAAKWAVTGARGPRGAPCQWHCRGSMALTRGGQAEVSARPGPRSSHSFHTLQACLGAKAGIALDNGICSFVLGSTPLERGGEGGTGEALLLQKPGLAAPTQPRVCLKRHRAGDVGNTVDRKSVV